MKVELKSTFLDSKLLPKTITEIKKYYTKIDALLEYINEHSTNFIYEMHLDMIVCEVLGIEYRTMFYAYTFQDGKDMERIFSAHEISMIDTKLSRLLSRVYGTLNRKNPYDALTSLRRGAKTLDKYKNDILP